MCSRKCAQPLSASVSKLLPASIQTPMVAVSPPDDSLATRSPESRVVSWVGATAATEYVRRDNPLAVERSCDRWRLVYLCGGYVATAALANIFSVQRSACFLRLPSKYMLETFYTFEVVGNGASCMAHHSVRVTHHSNASDCHLIRGRQPPREEASPREAGRRALQVCQM